MKSSNFWKNKNVLVTGALGFVGSNLSKALFDLGANVVTVKPDNKFNLTVNYPSTWTPKLYVGDVANQSVLMDVCKKESIDTIFHLAASAIVSKAAKEPFPTLKNNFLTTLNVLEIARLLGIKRTVIASSDKAYGDHVGDFLEPLPYKESYTLRGLDMYSVSKATSDIIAQAYALQFKMPVATIRFCNIYGPGDLNFTRLIPKNIFLLLSGKSPTIKSGHEHVLREYMYIDDAVSAYLLLGEKIEEYCDRNGGQLLQSGPQLYGWTAFNGGSYGKADLTDVFRCSNIASVRTVVKLLQESVKNNPVEIIMKPQEYVEIPDEYLDSSKILELGFVGSINLQEGIKKCAQWYNENFEKIKNIASSQINY